MNIYISFCCSFFNVSVTLCILYCTLVVTVKDEKETENPEPTEPTNPDTPDNPDESGGNNGKDIEDDISDSEEGTVQDTESNTDVEKGTTEGNVDIHTVVPEA